MITYFSRTVKLFCTKQPKMFVFYNTANRRILLHHHTIVPENRPNYSSRKSGEFFILCPTFIAILVKIC